MTSQPTTRFPHLRITLWLFSAAWLLAFALPLFASSNAHANTRIIVLGDSLSAGYGLTTGEGWVDLLSQKLVREKISAEVINASISGDTTAGGLSRLPALLQKHQPTHVIIELGGNDGLRGAPVASIRANLESMVKLSQNARAKVVLVGMQMPPNFGPNYTKPFAAMYGDLSKQYKTALVPFFLETIATDLRKFQPDRIHPTADAQPALLDTVWPVLQKTLK